MHELRHTRAIQTTFKIVVIIKVTGLIAIILCMDNVTIRYRRHCSNLTRGTVRSKIVIGKTYVS